MQEPLTRELAASPFSSISVPSPVFVVYGVLYAVALLALAVWSFQRRDF
jgi:hypothetical protein